VCNPSLRILDNKNGNWADFARYTRNISTIALKEALEKGNCPMCWFRSDTEGRFLLSLLWEYVNDPPTRERIIRSSGCCARHTRPLRRFEAKHNGTLLGNGILAARLTRAIGVRLRAYRKRFAVLSRSAIKRISRKQSKNAKNRIGPSGLDTGQNCSIARSNMYPIYTKISKATSASRTGTCGERPYPPRKRIRAGGHPCY
jgi:hypothetical protein